MGGVERSRLGLGWVGKSDWRGGSPCASDQERRRCTGRRWHRPRSSGLGPVGRGYPTRGSHPRRRAVGDPPVGVEGVAACVRSVGRVEALGNRRAAIDREQVAVRYRLPGAGTGVGPEAVAGESAELVVAEGGGPVDGVAGDGRGLGQPLAGAVGIRLPFAFRPVVSASEQGVLERPRRAGIAGEVSPWSRLHRRRL